MKDTKDKAYPELLAGKETWWKEALDVQLPYRLNLGFLDLGKVLDIGCGIGRNLRNLKSLGNHAVGVDHNEFSVKEARRRGYEAHHITEFMRKYESASEIFDSLLVSHVLEHMTWADAVELLKDYLHLLVKNGKIVLITPQERGFASDPTHIEFMDITILRTILQKAGCRVERAYSFPFPRIAGRIFRYNEFVAVGRKI